MHLLADFDVDLATWSLGTITGIIAVTMGLVEILKRIFEKNTGFGKIPVFVYAIAIAIVLTLLANKVFKVDNHPLLQGETFQVLWRAILGAGSASGFYTWINRPESVAKATPLGEHDKVHK